MLKDIVQVIPLDGYQLWLRFEDGVEGIVDISEMIQFRGIYAPLANREFFVQVKVNPDIGTICWSNDADIDPAVLYSRVTGTPLPTFSPETIRA